MSTWTQTSTIRFVRFKDPGGKPAWVCANRVQCVLYGGDDWSIVHVDDVMVKVKGYADKVIDALCQKEAKPDAD